MNSLWKPDKFSNGKPDKREVDRIKLATIVSMDSSKWDLELSNPQTAPEMETLLDKYRDHSLENNLFFEKTFLSAAFGRMNTGQTSLITLWETIDGVRYLRMYFPLVMENIGIPGKKVWRCWSHNYAPLGVPIVSRNDAGEVIDRFLQLLSQVEHSHYPALVFGDVPLEGVFATRMREALESAQTPYCQGKSGERAVLHRDFFGSSQSVIEINSKMRRNYRRQLKRLSELGELELECVSSYKDVILRFEEFMLLEVNGWKGRKGTSMHTIKQTAAFARQAVTDLAKFGCGSIYSIRLDGKSIASLVMLKSDGVYFPWKIAFDKEFSTYSPGALLMLKASEAIGAMHDFVRADSLAGSRNKLVNPLWKQRMELGALILPVGNIQQRKLEKVAAAIERKYQLTERARKFLSRG
jgi:hypothetical protein